MTDQTPADTARFTASAHAYAAEVFRHSPHEAQRKFAPVLDQWAAAANARADALSGREQRDLFA